MGPTEARLSVRDFYAVLNTHWCLITVVCHLAGFLSLWHISISILKLISLIESESFAFDHASLKYRLSTSPLLWLITSLSFSIETSMSCLLGLAYGFVQNNRQPKKFHNQAFITQLFNMEYKKETKDTNRIII